jgi:hypothetical protein
MNKYTRWYENLISSRRGRTLPGDMYVEKHHIIPRSLGGSDTVNNIIHLTAREHFIAHLLLVKIHSGKAGMKMAHALRRMLTGNKEYRYIPNSHTYAVIRTLAMEKCSGENNPMFGRTGENHPSYGRKEEIYNDEFRAKISATSKGRVSAKKGKVGVWKMSDEVKQKMAKDRAGVLKSDEHKRKIGDAQRGVPKAAKSIALITGANHYTQKEGYVNPRKGKPELQITCPYCNKTGGQSAMKRYHFANCKQKP